MPLRLSAVSNQTRLKVSRPTPRVCFKTDPDHGVNIHSSYKTRAASTSAAAHSKREYTFSSSGAAAKRDFTHSPSRTMSKRNYTHDIRRKEYKKPETRNSSRLPERSENCNNVHPYTGTGTSYLECSRKGLGLVKSLHFSSKDKTSPLSCIQHDLCEKSDESNKYRLNFTSLASGKHTIKRLALVDPKDDEVCVVNKSQNNQKSKPGARDKSKNNESATSGETEDETSGEGLGSETSGSGKEEDKTSETPVKSPTGGSSYLHKVKSHLKAGSVLWFLGSIALLTALLGLAATVSGRRICIHPLQSYISALTTGKWPDSQSTSSSSCKTRRPWEFMDNCQQESWGEDDRSHCRNSNSKYYSYKNCKPSDIEPVCF